MFDFLDGERKRFFRILLFCKIIKGCGDFTTKRFVHPVGVQNLCLRPPAEVIFFPVGQIVFFLKNDNSNLRLGVKVPMRIKKTERLQLRLTPEEKEKLLSKAAEARMTVSDYIANLLENKKVQLEKNIPALIYEINKIGVNINQMAYIANSQRYVNEELLNRVHQDMNEIKILVQKILSETYNSDEHTVGTLEQRISELIERVDSFGSSQGN